MLFKLAVVLFLIQFFSIVELVDPKPHTVDRSKQTVVNYLNNLIDADPINDPCPKNQSLHSRSDLKDLIDFVYQEQSIDEKIRKEYQSTAQAHRDKYIRDIKKLEDWLQNQPQHFKHVLESLTQIREDIIGPDVKKIAKLMQENSELLHVYGNKNKTLYNLKKKLRRYKAMCRFNCENDDHEALDHVVFKRSIQEDYICSSLKDLYKKTEEKMSQYVEHFNREVINRLSLEDKKYREKINNVTQSLHDKGLQKMSETIYNVLILQDDYHHFADKLNYTTVVEQINLLKNLSIQVDAHMLELSESIEDYGLKCRNCRNEPNIRHVRQVVTNTENEANNPKSMLDDLLEEKFHETAVRVQHDWDNIFKEVLDLIDVNKNTHLNLHEFEKIREELNGMIVQERQALLNLIENMTETGVEDIQRLIKLIFELIQVIKDIIHEIHPKTV